MFLIADRMSRYRINAGPAIVLESAVDRRGWAGADCWDVTGCFGADPRFGGPRHGLACPRRAPTPTPHHAARPGNSFVLSSLEGLKPEA